MPPLLEGLAHRVGRGRDFRLEDPPEGRARIVIPHPQMDRRLQRLEQRLEPAIRLHRLVADQIAAGHDEIRPQPVDHGDRLPEHGARVHPVLPPLPIRQDVQVGHVNEAEIRVGHQPSSPGRQASMNRSRGGCASTPASVSMARNVRSPSRWRGPRSKQSRSRR